MKLSNIEVVFENYLNQQESYYALLVNGSWGSGKTYFWKETLEPKAKTLGFKSIYISLNGISKIDALEHTMFIKLIPFLSSQDNSRIKSATAFLTNIVNQVAKSYLKSSLNDLLKGVSTDVFDFSKHIICFDDLERCQIPTVEVLGFINNYVEHKHVKTIILAAESHISDSYGGVKEKVIGRVLNFQLDIEDVLPRLFSRYQTSSVFYQFLIDYKTLISSLLVELKLSNLRVVKFYLDALESFYPAFANYELESIEKILRFAAAITIEFKDGKLKSTEYLDYKGLDKVDDFYLNRLRYELSKETDNTKDEKPYTDAFLVKYYPDYYLKYCFYASIYGYLLSGYLDISRLKLELEQNKAQKLSAEKDAFNKLFTYQFRHLENSDFQALTSEVLKYAEDGAYSIYDYASIANFYYFFCDKELIPKSVSEIDHILYSGLKSAAEREEINQYTLENLLHFSDDDARVTAIKREIAEIHASIDRVMKSGKNDPLVNSIISGEIDKMLDVFQKYKISEELFIHTDPLALSDAIKSASNKQVEIFERQLKQRYNSVNIGEFLSNDIPVLKSLHDTLKCVTETVDIGQPKLFVFRSLITRLEESWQHLEATRGTK